MRIWGEKRFKRGLGEKAAEPSHKGGEGERVLFGVHIRRTEKRKGQLRRKKGRWGGKNEISINGEAPDRGGKSLQGGEPDRLSPGTGEKTELKAFEDQQRK